MAEKNVKSREIKHEPKRQTEAMTGIECSDPYYSAVRTENKKLQQNNISCEK